MCKNSLYFRESVPAQLLQIVGDRVQNGVEDLPLVLIEALTGQLHCQSRPLTNLSGGSQTGIGQRQPGPVRTGSILADNKTLWTMVDIARDTSDLSRPQSSQSWVAVIPSGYWASVTK